MALQSREFILFRVTYLKLMWMKLDAGQMLRFSCKDISQQQGYAMAKSSKKKVKGLKKEIKARKAKVSKQKAKIKGLKKKLKKAS